MNRLWYLHVGCLVGMFASGVLYARFPIVGIAAGGVLALIIGMYTSHLSSTRMGFHVTPPALYTYRMLHSNLLKEWETATRSKNETVTIATPDAMFDMPIYVANPDIRPAVGILIARLNGRRSIVIERHDEEPLNV